MPAKQSKGTCKNKNDIRHNYRIPYFEWVNYQEVLKISDKTNAAKRMCLGYCAESKPKTALVQWPTFGLCQTMPRERWHPMLKIPNVYQIHKDIYYFPLNKSGIWNPIPKSKLWI